VAAVAILELTATIRFQILVFSGPGHTFMWPYSPLDLSFSRPTQPSIPPGSVNEKWGPALAGKAKANGSFLIQLEVCNGNSWAWLTLQTYLRQAYLTEIFPSLLTYLFVWHVGPVSPCEQGGSCVNTQGSFRCDCLVGFTGERCEININECQSSPCVNDGTCLDDIGEFRCVCLTGTSLSFSLSVSYNTECLQVCLTDYTNCLIF